MAAAILAFSGKYASCLVCLRLPAFKVLNLNLSLNLPQFAEWQHIQVKPHVDITDITRAKGKMAKDRYHHIVRKALEQEGWTITDDPLILETLKRDLEIDLGAERLIAAERGKEKIAIEIKSFLGLSQIHDFYKALGQFNYYSLALEEQEPDRTLFIYSAAIGFVHLGWHFPFGD